MNMSSPNSWLFSDNSRYSTQARLLFMALSFAIGIVTFLLYLCIWYICSLRRRPSTVPVDAESAPADSGLSAAAIAALPTFAYDDGAADEECAVCLGQVEAGEKVRRLPKCAHSFHAECVDAWLRAHTTCPMCRAPVGQAAAAAVTKAGGGASAETVVAVATPVPAAAEAPLPPV